MILLRMIPWGAQFEHLQGRIIFGMNELVLTWLEEEPMPGALCDDIVAALEDTASVPAAADVNISDADTAQAVAPARTSASSDTDLAATVQRLAAELATLKQHLA